MYKLLYVNILKNFKLLDYIKFYNIIYKYLILSINKIRIIFLLKRDKNLYNRK